MVCKERLSRFDLFTLEKTKKGLRILYLYTKWFEIDPKDKGMDSQRIKSDSYRLQKEKS